MQTDHTSRVAIWRSLVILAVAGSTACAQPPTPARETAAKIGSVPVSAVLQRLGAKLEQGVSDTVLEHYIHHFNRMDPNRDGQHTREEFVEQGRYLTPQSRAGIFRASDGNGDGVVTRAEYVLNRIITDEAKMICEAMDDNRNGLVERDEFVSHTTQRLSDADLAGQVFSALDTNADGKLYTSEYLHVWGQWARAGQKNASERIAARQAKLETASGRAPQPGFRSPGGGPPSGRPGPAGGPPDVEEIFQRFDRNEDGKLQKQEIPEFVQQFLLPADANRDNVVTEAELRAARQRQGGRPGGNSSRQPDRKTPPESTPGQSDNSSTEPSGTSRRGGPPRNSRQEVRAFLERAMQFDADKDGKLDREELLKLAEDQIRPTETGRDQPNNRPRGNRPRRSFR